MARGSKFAERLAPQSMEAERAVLGSIMLNGQLYAEAAEVVSASDFFLESHRKIFRAMGEIGMPGAIDLVTLTSALVRVAGSVEEVGGKAYLASLIDGIPRYQNIRGYARIVRDCAVRRQLIDAATRIANDSFAGTDEPPTLLAKAQGLLAMIAAGSSRGEDQAKAPGEYWQRLRELELSDPDRRRIVHTGTPIDSRKARGGYEPGEVLIVAARPGSGKTSCLLNMATYAAVNDHKRVLISSHEMTGDSLTERIIQIRHGITKRDAGAALRSDFWRRYPEDLDQWIVIDDQCFGNFPLMVNRIRSAHRTQPLAAVFIDYLQLLFIPGFASSRNEHIGQMTRVLKLLALELGIPLFIACQLSREGVKAGRWPQLQDLRESGNIEQDADDVVFLHSDELLQTKQGERPPALRDYWMIGAKVRNGNVGSVMATEYNLVTQRMFWPGMDDYDFRQHTTTFADWEPQQEEVPF